MLRRALPVVLLLAAAHARAEKPPSTSAKATPELPTAAPPREFDKYFLVILRRGPNWTAAETDATRTLLGQHLGHLKKLTEDGKLVVAGPFDEQQDPTAAGLALYRTATLDEARALASADPAVKAGRFTVEAMALYTEKGALAFPLADARAAKKPDARK